jgi:hypothetical protein
LERDCSAVLLERVVHDFDGAGACERAHEVLEGVPIERATGKHLTMNLTDAKTVFFAESVHDPISGAPLRLAGFAKALRNARACSMSDSSR